MAHVILDSICNKDYPGLVSVVCRLLGMNLVHGLPVVVNRPYYHFLNTLDPVLDRAHPVGPGPGPFSQTSVGDHKMVHKQSS